MSKKIKERERNIVRNNYVSMIDKLNDSFADNGWADGYADLPSDHEEIINQLYDKVPNADLIRYLDLYLQGYELGCFMSEEAENIYDEDGELKDDYNLDTWDHTDEARQLVLKYLSSRKQKKEIE